MPKKMKKVEVIAALKEKGIEFDEGTKYNDLCKLLKEAKASVVNSDPHALTQDGLDDMGDPVVKPPVEPIYLESRIPKRNIFLADSVRDERDSAVLRQEITKRVYKGKITKITTVKHMQLVDGCWLTEFVIELKS